MNTMYKLHKTSQSQSKGRIEYGDFNQSCFQGAQATNNIQVYQFRHVWRFLLTKILKRSWFDLSAANFDESDLKETVKGI